MHAGCRPRVFKCIRSYVVKSVVIQFNTLCTFFFPPQLQLTQKTTVPQEAVSIIVPIIYDMASGTTQQADIPRQQNSSVAAPMMVSNILKRFAELNSPRPGTVHVQ